MQLTGLKLPKVTIKDLYAMRAHIGHRACFKHPKMRDYLIDKPMKDLQIIDLDQTRSLLQEALKFVASVVARRGQVLFVGTKRAAAQAIEAEGVRCGMPYVNHRWIPGTLTNYNKILKPIKQLQELEAKIESGYLENLTKKEGLTLMRKKGKLERGFGGIKNMQGLPDLIFIVDVGREHIALLEANKLKIPVIAIVDTNHSPEGVDKVIPSNDDAYKLIELYAKLMSDVIIETRRVAKLDVIDKEQAGPKVSVVKKKVVSKPTTARSETQSKGTKDKTEQGSAAKSKQDVAKTVETTTPKVVRKRVTSSISKSKKEKVAVSEDEKGKLEKKEEDK